jgi:catechol 2,3-dioxygenase-like lactoylglutathione lyase family enzyme
MPLGEILMPLVSLDHENIQTANLDKMVEWYGDVLGLVSGPRPPFSMGGAWMYIGDAPVVHLVDVENEPKGTDPRIEHFSFMATGMAGFLAKLKQHGIAYTIDPVPQADIVQVNLHDCSGNHIHVDFSKTENDARA